MFLKGRKGCVWMQGNEQLLEVSGLETAFRIKDDYYNAVDDVSFELKKMRFWQSSENLVVEKVP